MKDQQGACKDVVEVLVIVNLCNVANIVIRMRRYSSDLSMNSYISEPKLDMITLSYI